MPKKRLGDLTMQQKQKNYPKWSREKKGTGIPCSIVLHRYCNFYKLKVCSNPASRVYQCLFSNSICSFHVSLYHFAEIFSQYFKLLIIIMMISTSDNLLKAQIIAFFSNEVFLIKVYTLFFLEIMLLHT